MGVPDTTTFTLQNVVTEVNPTTDDLVDCFADADSNKFDSTYEGSKNQLLNFRNYGAGSLTSFSMTNGAFAMTGSANSACNYLNGLTTYTYYHNGSGLLPVAGDTCYHDSAGNTPVNRTADSWTGNASNTLYQWNANSGILQAVISCPSVTQFSGSAGQSDIKSICTQTIATNYWHDGSGTLPAVGDRVYTNSGGTTATAARYIRAGLSYYTFSALNGIVTQLDLC